jgi:hypothetical protein
MFDARKGVVMGLTEGSKDLQRSQETCRVFVGWDAPVPILTYQMDLCCPLHVVTQQDFDHSAVF